ncbi:MAG TPA: adenylate/guanylate cyclase domain-containing protein [Beijerinckiaceae bacterium]|nr:adenylate/guanylate cyclase domain-containing protein [Beijerinckiaceae bacterium]
MLVADVVGYARLMGVDEVGTHNRLQKLRTEQVDPTIVAHGGRIVKLTGDGLLAEFPSSVSALAAAIALQRAIRSLNGASGAGHPIVLRIGINVDDIIVEPEDIYGNGVNIASRLEGLSPPGGICISEAVYSQVPADLVASFEDLGNKRVKNIRRPVRAFALTEAGIAELSAGTIEGLRLHVSAKPPAVARGRRSSIAVLPFSQAGHDGPDYLAEGIVEDIINGLSLFRSLYVTAQGSSSIYRGLSLPEQAIARQLDVRYLVTGSLRHAGGRLRITVQLVDTTAGEQIWTSSFDGSADDLFGFQDEITRRIVTAIEPRVLASEIRHAQRLPAENLDAHDYFLRALPHRVALSPGDTEQALTLLREAIRLDPSYAPALAHAAACYLARHDQGWQTLREEEREEGLRLARAAIDADRYDPVALALGGHTIASLTGDYAAGLMWIDRALSLNINYAEGWMRSSMVRVYANELEEAIVHADRAMELSPVDPKLYHPLCAQGYAHFFSRRYEAACDAARRALMGTQKPEMAYRILIASLMASERHEEAGAAVAEFRRQFPTFRISTWRSRSKFTADPRFEPMAAALREAGLPE